MAQIQDQEDLNIFLEELNENLSYLDTAIISLEKNPEDKDTLEEIFRVAHTVKGNAGFLDLKNLVELGHSMESVFQEFHKGSLAVTHDVIDTLLACKDTISTIGSALAEDTDPSSIATAALVKKLNSYVEKGLAAGTLSESSSNIDETSLNEIETKIEYIPGTTLLRVWISPNEPAPSVRAFLVQNKIAQFGEIMMAEPGEEELESHEFSISDRELLFYIRTELDPEEIPDHINVDLIERIEVLSEEELKRRFERASQAGNASEEFNRTVKEDLSVQDTVRIPVERLDVLLNLVGELVIANSGLLQVQEMAKSKPELAEIDRQLKDRVKEIFRISADVQELVMKSRLVPISQIFNRFKRFVRDYSSRSEKDIELIIAGDETEIDKKIIDEMIKPMTHIVRNAVDHGLETIEEREAAGKNPTGTLKLNAFQEGNYINVVIEDDGRGIDVEKVVQKAVAAGILKKEDAKNISIEDARNLIFHSGLSTKEVVDDLSGRGIGMDIVKRSIEVLNGTLDIDTEKGRGTKVIIKLPLTLAIINALIVVVGDEKFSVPMASIVETQKVSTDNILMIEGSEMLRLRNSLVPLIRLEKIFELKRSTPLNSKVLPVIIVEYNETLVGILVDQFQTRHEMVIKSLSEHYRPVEGISGASILGDGEIILILDVHGIIQLYKGNTSEKSTRILFHRKDPLTNNVIAEEPEAKGSPEKPDEDPEQNPEENNKSVEQQLESENTNDLPAEKSASVDEITNLTQTENTGKQQPVNETETGETNMPENKPDTSQSAIDAMIAAAKAGTLETNEEHDDGALSFHKEEFREESLRKLQTLFDAENRELLKDWMRQGNARAIQGIQAMTGSLNIKIDRSKGKHISIEKVQKLLDKIENGPQEVIDFALPINPLEGGVHFILTRKNALKIVRLLMRQANLPEPDEIDYEPIMEVTNILGSAYTNSLTQITEVPVEPGVPEIIEGRENLLETMQKIVASQPFEILYVENQFTWENEDISAELLILIPEIKI